MQASSYQSLKESPLSQIPECGPWALSEGTKEGTKEDVWVMKLGSLPLMPCNGGLGILALRGLKKEL